MEAHLTHPGKSVPKEIIILSLCLLVGFFLRFYTFDQKSLWFDEIYTFNDSRDGIRDQLKFYGENPTYLHPPLFFIFTHFLYPFTKPERDLRIVPLIFGTLSIPMIYFLSRLFRSSIALPCALSLTFMAYHISLSQEGRAYSMLMFLGMAGVYFFMKHLNTSKDRYLFLVALFFSALFYASYSSIPFIAFSQILWFYRVKEGSQKPRFSSFLILTGFVFLLCLPWLLFIATHYKNQPFMHPLHTENAGTLWTIAYGILHDWVPHAPLTIISVVLLILFPILSRNRRNAFILSALFILAIGGFYLFCTLLKLNHFVTSRYFINFLPLFFISLFLSLDTIEFRFNYLKKSLRLKVLFVILLIASNLLILPLYYRSEKQDLRGLATYLKGHLKNGDKIIVGTMGYIPGMTHYFGAYPEGRHYVVSAKKVSEEEIEYAISLILQDITFTISNSTTHWYQYLKDGSRLWIVASKQTAKGFKNSGFLLKGYFDGSFLNFTRFPTDASLYLFLWDPKSPNEKGIDIPIE